MGLAVRVLGAGAGLRSLPLSGAALALAREGALTLAGRALPLAGVALAG